MEYAYDDIKNMKYSEKRRPQIRSYVTGTFSTNEIVRGILDHDFVLYLNQLFKQRQFSKDQLKQLFASNEFRKNCLVRGSKITTKENAIRAMINYQNDFDGDVLETFYDHFIQTDPDFVTSTLKYINYFSNKKWNQQINMTISERMKSILEGYS